MQLSSRFSALNSLAGILFELDFILLIEFDITTFCILLLLLLLYSKGTVHPGTGHEGPEGEYSYRSTLSLITSGLNGGGWSTPRPGRFTPWKETWYPLYRRLGEPRGRSGRVLKISLQPGFDPRTVQPIASRCTD